MHFRKSRPKLPILAGIMDAVSNGLTVETYKIKYPQNYGVPKVFLLFSPFSPGSRTFLSPLLYPRISKLQTIIFLNSYHSRKCSFTPVCKVNQQFLNMSIIAAIAATPSFGNFHHERNQASRSLMKTGDFTISNHTEYLRQQVRLF